MIDTGSQRSLRMRIRARPPQDVQRTSLRINHGSTDHPPLFVDILAINIWLAVRWSRIIDDRRIQRDGAPQERAVVRIVSINMITHRAEIDDVMDLAIRERNAANKKRLRFRPPMVVRN